MAEIVNAEKDQSNKETRDGYNAAHKENAKSIFFKTVLHCMIRLVKNYLQNLGKPKCHKLPRIDSKLCTTVSKAELNDAVQDNLHRDTRIHKICNQVEKLTTK